MELFLRTWRIPFAIYPVELTMIYAMEAFESKKLHCISFYQFSFILAIVYSCDKTGHKKLVIVLLNILKTKYYCAIELGLHDLV